MDVVVWSTSLVASGASIALSVMVVVLSWRAYKALSEVDKRVAVIQATTGDTLKTVIAEVLAQSRLNRESRVSSDELLSIMFGGGR